MTSYGNLQNDKSQRIAIESLLDGTSPAMEAKQDATIPAGDLAAGSVPRDVVDKLAELGISSTDLGVPSDGVTDAAAALRAADATLAGDVLHLPIGDTLLSTVFSTGSGTYVYPQARVMQGHPSGRSRLLIDCAVNTRPFSFYGSGTTIRCNTKSAASPHEPVFLIDDAVAGQGWVQVKAADLTAFQAYYDAGSLVAGNLIHVACGINVQDADDDLWEYDQLHEVERVDRTTGRVYLRDTVDVELNDRGWAADGLKDAAIAWANGVSITAGDYRLNGTSTTLSSLYVASTSGTTNGASLAADVGVTWLQVTTNLKTATRDSLGLRDGRAVIQKAPATTCRDMIWRDLTIDWESKTSGTTPQIMFDMKSVYNIRFERVKWRRGVCYIAEASRYVYFIDCDGDYSHNQAYWALPLSIYQARKVYAINSRFSGGGLTTATNNSIIRLESYAELIMRGGSIGMNDHSSTEARGIYADRGEIRLDGVQIGGTSEPIRPPVTARLEGETGRYWAVSINGCHIRISRKAFRGTSTFYPTYYGDQNTYTIVDAYSNGTHVQRMPVFANRLRAVELPFSFSVATNQNNLRVNFAAVDVRRYLCVTNIREANLIYLGLTAYWTTPGANDLTVRCFAYEYSTGSGARKLIRFSDSGQNMDGIILNTTTPGGSNFTGDGVTYRFIQANVEELAVAYFSTASAGGTCSGVAHLLQVMG